MPKAIRVLVREANLNSLAYGCLVGGYAHLGRMDEARDTLDTDMHGAPDKGVS